MSRQHCFVCNSWVDSIDFNNDFTVCVTCPVCGKYAFSRWDLIQNRIKQKDVIAAYLFYKNKLLEHEHSDEYTMFIGSVENYGGLQVAYPHFHFVSIDEMKAFYPSTFSRKVDYSLFAISQKSTYYSERVEFSNEEMVSLLFLRRYDRNDEMIAEDELKNQYRSILEYLEKQKYIAVYYREESKGITLLADGWKKIEDLFGSQELNRNVFVAMSFDPSLNGIREAIRKGIIEAHFSAEIMDEIIHNKDIIPEMYRLIRECRLLVMDITEPNYGAYYEAGYALGLGKEVIITCNSSSKNLELPAEEKKYEKYLRPHFDIANRQILFWNDYEDLTKKLSEWIKALF